MSFVLLVFGNLLRQKIRTTLTVIGISIGITAVVALGVITESARAAVGGLLTGGGAGPTPVEFLLHGLAACLTAGIANVAAARGVTLSEVAATVEGDIDLQGILGLSKEVRNGYQGIRVSFRIKGDAPEEKLRQIVEQSQARSAVFDIITNKTPVEIGITVG